MAYKTKKGKRKSSFARSMASYKRGMTQAMNALSKMQKGGYLNDMDNPFEFPDLKLSDYVGPAKHGYYGMLGGNEDIGAYSLYLSPSAVGGVDDDFAAPSFGPGLIDYNKNLDNKWDVWVKAFKSGNEEAAKDAYRQVQLANYLKKDVETYENAMKKRMKNRKYRKGGSTSKYKAYHEARSKTGMNPAAAYFGYNGARDNYRRSPLHGLAPIGMYIGWPKNGYGGMTYSPGGMMPYMGGGYMPHPYMSGGFTQGNYVHVPSFAHGGWTGQENYPQFAPMYGGSISKAPGHLDPYGTLMPGSESGMYRYGGGLKMATMGMGLGRINPPSLGLQDNRREPMMGKTHVVYRRDKSPYEPVMYYQQGGPMGPGMGAPPVDESGQHAAALAAQAQGVPGAGAPPQGAPAPGQEGMAGPAQGQGPSPEEVQQLVQAAMQGNQEALALLQEILPQLPPEMQQQVMAMLEQGQGGGQGQGQDQPQPEMARMGGSIKSRRRKRKKRMSMAYKYGGFMTPPKSR